MIPASEMSTPELLREYVEIKIADARGEEISYDTHMRLTAIVIQLRKRSVSM